MYICALVSYLYIVLDLLLWATAGPLLLLVVINSRPGQDKKILILSLSALVQPLM